MRELGARGSGGRRREALLKLVRKGPCFWPDTRPREERRGRPEGAQGTPFGWTLAAAEAHEELEELPASQIYRLLIAADLHEAPPEAWERMRAELQNYGCVVSRQKEHHWAKYNVVPYRLTVRGDHPELGCQAVLDILLREVPTIVQPTDCLLYTSDAADE